MQALREVTALAASQSALEQQVSGLQCENAALRAGKARAGVSRQQQALELRRVTAELNAEAAKTTVIRGQLMDAQRRFASVAAAAGASPSKADATARSGNLEPEIARLTRELHARNAEVARLSGVVERLQRTLVTIDRETDAAVRCMSETAAAAQHAALSASQKEQERAAEVSILTERLMDLQAKSRSLASAQDADDSVAGESPLDVAGGLLTLVQKLCAEKVALITRLRDAESQEVRTVHQQK